MGERWTSSSPRPNSVRSAAPARDASRPEPRPASPKRGTPVAVERPGTPEIAPRWNDGTTSLPEQYAALTPAQREDLRLWHGRVELLDRVRAIRGYTFLTAGAVVLSMFALGVAFDSQVPPLILAPLVPWYMSVKLWNRGKSLRESGFKLRRVLLPPRAAFVIRAPKSKSPAEQLEKIAPREILDSAHGPAIRRAASDRAAILEIATMLPKPHRAMLADIAPTSDALVERVVHLAQMIHRLDQSFDPRVMSDLDASIAQLRREGGSVEGSRQLALLQRQRETVDELVQRRAALVRQLESAGLALGSLRLDLVRFRSSGLQSALAGVSTATQEARALSREIGILLESAAEAGKL